MSQNAVIKDEKPNTDGTWYEFDSQIQLGPLLPEFSQEEVKNEPMIFNGSLRFAFNQGGPITKAFIRAFLEKPLEGVGEEDIILDSRVHMLMPGWYGAIPGWHHDDVPRTREDKQPNYDTPEYRSQHVMALVNGDIAPTKFALGKHALPKVSEGKGPVYKHWNKLVEVAVENEILQLYSAPSNRLIYFDCHTMHKADKAVGNGWRWFGRISWNTNRKPTNEIRRQVQVYLPHPMEGW